MSASQSDKTGTAETKLFRFGSAEQPFALDCGETLPGVTLAYETYGTLSEARDNCVLVFHALTGSQHAAGLNPAVEGIDHWTEECQVGWWDGFIGPGRAFDTDRFFVLCVNYLGGCYGSTGPMSINPETGKPWGSAFPDVTIGDICRSHIPLLDHLGVEKVLAATGGSMGGMLAIDFAIQFPDRIRSVIPVATAAGVSELTKMHNFEQIFALQEDPNFHGGDYYDKPERPRQGVVLARMISHKTFVSLDVLRRRALGQIIQPEDFLPSYHLRHRTESYMLHQGRKFAARFDTNSYLKILVAWQTFNLANTYGDGSLERALRPSQEAGHRYLVFTVDSDVCFYPEEQHEIVKTLMALGIDHTYYTVHSQKGHDSFLTEPQLYAPLIRHHLDDVVTELRGTRQTPGPFAPEI